MFQTSMAGNTLVAALALQSFGIGILGEIGLWQPLFQVLLH